MGMLEIFISLQTLLISVCFLELIPASRVWLGDMAYGVSLLWYRHSL